MTEDNKHPDFPDWIKSKEGQSCLTWPVGDTTYLQNRLFWAFDAGRNCVWDQYLQNKAELKRKDSEISELKEALKSVLIISMAMHQLLAVKNGFDEQSFKETKEIIDKARNMIELKEPEK